MTIAARPATPHEASPAPPPTATCDLVMKGGITSGVVYPPALLRLKDAYRFANIGGASAGAIAAAAAAAAEFGREAGGFDTLARMSEALRAPGFLRQLFRANRRTAPLLAVILACFDPVPPTQSEHQPPAWRLLRLGGRLAGALTWGNAVAFLAGVLGALGLALLFVWATAGALAGWRWLPVLAVAAVGGVVGSGLGLLWIAFWEVPRNDFGICRGRLDDLSPEANTEMLTDWLAARLDELAGPDAPRPLTFGTLRTRRVGAEGAPLTLELVTTDLSQSQPYKLPFTDQRFLFAKADMERLFPPDLVTYLTALHFQDPLISLEHYPGFFWLPAGDALPVAVAMRLSLSVPPIISAVRLYTIQDSVWAQRPPRVQWVLPRDSLQAHWFTDGGVTHNFPVNFFDHWLPRRPTLGIKLTAMPPEAVRRAPDQVDQIDRAYQSAVPQVPVGDRAPTGATTPTDPLADAVLLPRADEVLAPEWQPITSLLGFGRALFDTAREHRDNTLSTMPGFRERIVQIRFDKNEGGLNLAMDPDTIQRIMDKGDRAGERLVKDFSFDYHRWTRFLIIMERLEEQLTAMGHAYADGDYAHLLSDAVPPPAAGFPYWRDATWCQEAAARAALLLAVIRQWEAGGAPPAPTHTPAPDFFTDQGQTPPTPAPVLQPNPEL